MHLLELFIGNARDVHAVHAEHVFTCRLAGNHHFALLKDRVLSFFCYVGCNLICSIFILIFHNLLN
ncbi:Uncharacterised protein [Segatella copri]|nr:Uncharacterised protein [Segatella copri]